MMQDFLNQSRLMKKQSGFKLFEIIIKKGLQYFLHTEKRRATRAI